MTNISPRCASGTTVNITSNYIHGNVSQFVAQMGETSNYMHGNVSQFVAQMGEMSPMACVVFVFVL